MKNKCDLRRAGTKGIQSQRDSLNYMFVFMRRVNLLFNHLINLSFCFWFESLDIFFVFKLFPPVTKEIKFNLNGMLFLILASVA